MSAKKKKIARLEREWRALQAQRGRQLGLFRSTSRLGHARRAAELGRKMRRIRARIQNLQSAQPSWKLEYAARFVSFWEGLLTTAYRDTGGILTIGYGHTGPDVYEGQTITKARALTLLAADLRLASRAVARHVKVPLTIRERIAAISFTFNVGEGGLMSSTFLRKLNEGDRKGAADALLLWVKDDRGNRLLGLERRRQAERWMFYNPKKGVKA
jgi:GH24 family phage-related lysozyme (muramidase)